MTLDCFERKMWHDCIKIEIQKIANFLDTTSDDKDLPKFVTKEWFEVYDQSGRNYSANKEIRIKTSILRSDLCDFNDAYIVVKGDITLKVIMMLIKEIKILHLKIMHHLLVVFQKLMA